MVASRKKQTLTLATNLRISLRAVVYQEDDWWLAHCLELDLVAEGKTAKDALANLQGLCAFQIKVAWEDGDLESIFRPAPPETWRMFFLGVEMPAPRKPQSPIDRFEARKLVFA